MTDKMTMDVSYGRAGVVGKLHVVFPNAWLSSFIQNGIMWMLGKGIWTFSISRKLISQGTKIKIEMKAGCKDQLLKFSSRSSLQTMADHRVIPEDLSHLFTVEDNPEDALILTQDDLNLDYTLSVLSFQLSEIIIAFFEKGAENVRYQISTKRAQLWADVGMSHAEIQEFISSPVQYNDTAPIDNFPWRSKKKQPV